MGSCEGWVSAPRRYFDDHQGRVAPSLAMTLAVYLKLR
jgi:hypothetical protein